MRTLDPEPRPNIGTTTLAGVGDPWGAAAPQTSFWGVPHSMLCLSPIRMRCLLSPTAASAFAARACEALHGPVMALIQKPLSFGQVSFLWVFWVFVVFGILPVVSGRVSYGKGFDTETFSVGAGSLSFCVFSWFLVVSLGFPACCPTLPALF